MVKILIEPIVPKELFNVDKVRMELLNALRAEGRAIKRDYGSVTANWKHKPSFETKVSLRRTQPEGYVQVWTEDEIFTYVDLGTKPHQMGPITPKPPRKALKIPSARSTKTRPRSLKPHPRVSVGPFKFIKRTGVFRHPGTEPRLISQTIAEKIDRSGRFCDRIQGAINRGLSKAMA